MPYVTEENLTDVALDRWKNIPDPRLRQIMQSLIKHRGRADSPRMALYFRV
jgi:hypothetical protein